VTTADTASIGAQRRVCLLTHAGRGSNGVISSMARASPAETPRAVAIASARLRASPTARAVARSRWPSGAKPAPEKVMPAP
jgi:hypothetical protein